MVVGCCREADHHRMHQSRGQAREPGMSVSVLRRDMLGIDTYSIGGGKGGFAAMRIHDHIEWQINLTESVVFIGSGRISKAARRRRRRSRATAVVAREGTGGDDSCARRCRSRAAIVVACQGSGGDDRCARHCR